MSVQLSCEREMSCHVSELETEATAKLGVQPLTIECTGISKCLKPETVQTHPILLPLELTYWLRVKWLSIDMGGHLPVEVAPTKDSGHFMESGIEEGSGQEL